MRTTKPINLILTKELLEATYHILKSRGIVENKLQITRRNKRGINVIKFRL